jgi:hypothetical protein
MGKRPEHRTYYADEPTTGNQQKARCITGAQFDALAICDLRRPGCPRGPHAQVSSTPSRDNLDRSKDGWKTVEGKAAQKKRRNDKANKRATTTANHTPKTMNGRRGKNTHQPRMNTPSAKKTWAEVVKSGGINVQIVLGNGNLGLTTPPTKNRRERRGGAARRLGRKEGVGERGEERRGNVGPPGACSKEASTTGGGGERVEESRGGRGPAAV